MVLFLMTSFDILYSAIKLKLTLTFLPDIRYNVQTPSLYGGLYVNIYVKYLIKDSSK